MTLNMRPEIADLTIPVMEMYMALWVSVRDKVGLVLDAGGNPSDSDANDQGTNHTNRAKVEK